MDNSGEAKPIVHIYPKLNTPEDAAATDFAKKIIGISDWDKIMFKGEIKQFAYENPSKKSRCFQFCGQVIMLLGMNNLKWPVHYSSFRNSTSIRYIPYGSDN